MTHAELRLKLSLALNETIGVELKDQPVSPDEWKTLYHRFNDIQIEAHQGFPHVATHPVLKAGSREWCQVCERWVENGPADSTTATTATVQAQA